MDIGSPVTNKHYIAQPHGEIYGLDHSRQRFDLEVDTRLRPETDVPGLYLTGQGGDSTLSHFLDDISWPIVALGGQTAEQMLLN